MLSGCLERVSIFNSRIRGAHQCAHHRRLGKAFEFFDDARNWSTMDCVIGSGNASPVSPYYDGPGQTLDYVTGATVLVCTIPFVFGNAVMVWYRNYPPIKSKSVVLTLVSSCGGLIWLAATFVTNGHFASQRNGTVLGLCWLWTIWLRVTFGFVLWLSCFLLRLVNLRLILIMKRGAIKHVMVALLVILSPLIIYATFMTSFKGNRYSAMGSSDHSITIKPQGINHDDPPRECTVVLEWEIGLTVIVIIYFGVFIGLAVSLRNVPPPYNEIRWIRNGGICLCFLSVLNGVTYHTMQYHEVTGRCFLVLIHSGAVFYYFWARNSDVVYNVLFNKEQYLANFLNQMNSVPSSGQLCDPNPLESLFFEIRNEVASARAEVQELEHAVAELQEEYRHESSWENLSARRGGASADQRPQSIFANLECVTILRTELFDNSVVA